MVVTRFVDAHAPKNYRRMIPITLNHLLNILQGELLPIIIADVLPARNFLEDQQAIFIAAIQKMRRLWIMRSAHDVALEFFAQNPRVALLDSRGHCLANVGKSLMTVQPAQLQMLSVQVEAFRCELRFTKSDPRLKLIDDTVSF